MRLAIVNPTHGNFSGGYTKYLMVLLPLIASNPDIDSVVTYIPHGTRRLFSCEDVPIIECPAGDHLRRYSWLRRTVVSSTPDVIFSPTARWMHFDDVPVVTMVRNMEPLALPRAAETRKELLKNVMRARVAHQAALRSTRIIAVSEYVRRFLIDKWAISPSSIGLVYHGVAKADSAKAPPSSWSPSFPSDFLFTAGSLRPARGLEDMIGALSVLHAEGRKLHLVIAGRASNQRSLYQSSIEALVNRAGLAGFVHWVGHLAPSEMSWCFSRSVAFVMTSRVEACPNTLLEAMAHGCLCVSSDHEPMPEFLQDCGLYYRGGDAQSLALQLFTAMELSQERRTLLRNGVLRRSREFSWDSTAQSTVYELRQAAGS